MCLIKPKETEYVDETIIAPRRSKTTTYAYEDGTYARERVIIPSHAHSTSRRNSTHSHRSHHSTSHSRRNSKTYLTAVPVAIPPPPPPPPHHHHQMIENVYDPAPAPQNTVIVPVEVERARSFRGSRGSLSNGGGGGGSVYGGSTAYGGGGSSYAGSTRYIEDGPRGSSSRIASQVYTSERVAPAVVVERRGSRSYY